MKRPLVLFLVMIGLIAAMFGSSMLMGSLMEDSVNEMSATNGGSDSIFQDYHDKYTSVKEIYIPKLDEGQLDLNSAEVLTEYVFDYYYRCYDKTVTITGTDDTETVNALDEIRNSYMLDVLHSRLFFTDEDMEAARDDIMENGYFHASEARKYSDRYYERFK